MSKKRILLLAMLLQLTSIGCRCFEGRDSGRRTRADLPEYSINEQKRRARDRYAWQDEDFRVGPSSGAERPSPTGR